MKSGFSPSAAPAKPLGVVAVPRTQIPSIDITDSTPAGRALLTSADSLAALGTFQTPAAIASAQVPVTTSVIATLGYATPGDGGGGRYIRVGSQPSHALKRQSADGAWWELLPENGAINVLQAGAKGDNSTNDRAAFQGCLDFVGLYAGTRIRLPKNRIYRVDTSGTAGLAVPNDIELEGEDRWTTKIKFVEASSGSSFNGYDHLFKGDDKSRLRFRNFTIEGQLDESGITQGSANFFSFTRATDIVFERMIFRKNRAVIVNIKGADSLVFIDSEIFHNKGGGLIVRDCYGARVERNKFLWCRDDPVNIGQNGDQRPNWATGPRTAGGDIFVNDNYCLGSRSLNVVGGKRVHVCRNIHRLGKGLGIHVGTSSDGGNGDTTSLDILIDGNHVIDLLGAAVGGDGASSATAIQLELMSADAGGVGIPGVPNAAGVILDPFLYYHNSNQGFPNDDTLWAPGQSVSSGDRYYYGANRYVAASTGTTGATPPTHTSGTVSDGGVTWTFSSNPTPHQAGIRIVNNRIGRSLPHSDGTGGAPANWNALNLGPYYIQEPPGTANPSITKAQMMPEGIAIKGSARGLVIAGNRITNCLVGIQWDGQNISQPLRVLDCVIENNDIEDVTNAAIRMRQFIAGERQRLLIRGNRVRGDPFHWHAQRLANGTWADNSTGSFFDGGAFAGAFFEGNHVRDVPRIFASFDATRHFGQGNIVYCDPAYTGTGNSGYNAGNKGVGNLLAPGQGWDYVIEDCDPASATYGAILNNTLAQVTAMPTAGKWLRGQRALNRLPTVLGLAGSQYMVLSWRRLTSAANAHVANTDWAEERVLTGT